MRSLARNVGTMTGVKTRAREVAGAEEAIDHKTAFTYYDALDWSFKRYVRRLGKDWLQLGNRARTLRGAGGGT